MASRSVSRRAAIAAAAAAAVSFPAVSRGSDFWSRLAGARKEEFDVVVIGSGAAGLAAAAEAAAGGASTLVLERENEIGGDTAMTGGFFAAVDPARQRPLGIEDSEELFFRQTFEGGGSIADAALVRTMTRGAGEALAWLESLGMKFDDTVLEIYGAHWPRCHKPAIPGGGAFVRTLSAAAASRGAELRLGARAVRLVVEGNPSRVAGVVYETGNGARSASARRGVVIASGGFGQNSVMVERCAPRFAGLTCDSSPGATGEMLLEAERIGAALRDMQYIQCLPGCPPGRAHRVRLHNDVSRFIFVNAGGRRFIAEDASRDAITDAILALPGRYAFTVTDQAGVDSYNILFQKEAVLGVESGDAWVADTVGELAEAAGLPPADLRRTVDSYNKCVDEGTDSLGKRRGDLRHRIEKPPFWACLAGMTIHYTMGGVAIDEKARVLCRDGRPIPGLYAAGQATGGVHGRNRLGGNGLADAIVFGRIAGRTAAAGTGH